jgi:transposase-like zinc-binding protein
MANIVRTHHSDLLVRWNHVLSREQRKALRDIRDCRSAALGGRLQQCDRCGHRVILYNSCRNRHCPKCQAQAGAHWLSQRESELLPVPYFHVIFTLPSQIGKLALQNPKRSTAFCSAPRPTPSWKPRPIPDCSALKLAF